MSPVASGGPPYTRATPVNGGGPIRTTNGTAPTVMDSLKGTTRVFPHLDDLVGVRPDVNINLPFKSILQMGENASKQADTHLDFRRPDVALQEYMKATIIAVEILPNHKDFSALRDRPELNRMYSGFKKRINSQHEKFAEVRDVIKENNARSGVRPAADRISAGTEPIQFANGEVNGHARSRSDQIGIPAAKRLPPPLQPKPNALHGNIIVPVSNGTQPTDQLLARFARLRGPDPQPQVQDPRIRTQPIVIPDRSSSDVIPSTPARNSISTSRPIGLRELPSVPKTLPQQPKISVNVNFAGMPRAPDAIYSPDRGVESTAGPPLTSSSSFSNVRKYSAPPISTVGPSPLLLDNRREYFSPAHTVDDAAAQKSLKRARPSIPESTMISAEDLMNYIGQGSQALRILLVDLRSREDFDSGHIMSQSIICVEPISLEHGISGEALGETMVLGPDTEPKLYEQRQDFDLVVVYDQNSTSWSGSGSNPKLQDFMSAVYDYGYDKRLKRRPALLVGGLNSWIDLLGPNALKVTPPGDSSVPRQVGKSNPPLSKAIALRNSYINDRSKRRTFRQLTSQEQNYWETKLSSKGADSEDGTSDEFSYAKTTEDFFRRYPELPSLQQSMISPVQELALEHQRLDDELQNLTPTPPTRPAPALPRQRSSGVSDRRLMVSPAHAAPSNSITSGHNPSALTGLTNEGNTCYINSAVQALSATVLVRDFLRDFRYPSTGQRLPAKPEENGNECPQLMVRCFGNLLGHLWRGTYDYVKPATFLKYIVSVDDASKPHHLRFAVKGGRQQDASEFYFWLINMLEDESNPGRAATAVNDEVPDDLQIQWSLPTVSISSACDRALKYLFTNRTSPISQHMDLIVHQQNRCRSCGYNKRKWVVERGVQFLMALFEKQRSRDLVSHLEHIYGVEDSTSLPGYACEKCHVQDTTHQTNYISHFPDYLVVNLGRFQPSDRTDGAGNTLFYRSDTTVRFEETVDLSKCFVPIPASEPQNRLRQTTGPFKYEVYAVIRHLGHDLGSGHYQALVRHLDQPAIINGAPGPGSWHLFNDSKVSPFTERDICKNAAMIFLKRVGSPNK